MWFLYLLPNMVKLGPVFGQWSFVRQSHDERNRKHEHDCHYNDVIMGRIASQITSLTIVYSIVYSGVYQRKHQSPASLVFVRGIHRRPVNSPHKWPVTRKKFPFGDVIMVKFSHGFCPHAHFCTYHDQELRSVYHFAYTECSSCQMYELFIWLKLMSDLSSSFFAMELPLWKPFSNNLT